MHFNSAGDDSVPAILNLLNSWFCYLWFCYVESIVSYTWFLSSFIIMCIMWIIINYYIILTIRNCLAYFVISTALEVQRSFLWYKIMLYGINYIYSNTWTMQTCFNEPHFYTDTLTVICFIWIFWVEYPVYIACREEHILLVLMTWLSCLLWMPDPDQFCPHELSTAVTECTE